MTELRWYALLSYIRMCCSSAINIIDLCSYMLQSLAGTHCCSTLVRTARPPSTLPTCVRTCCRTSWVDTAVQFVRVANLRWYALLSCTATCCPSAVNIVNLCSYILQNLIANHCCYILVHAVYQPPLPLATLVHTTRMPSTSLTCVSTRCRASFVGTTVLHSYTLLVCCQHC